MTDLKTDLKGSTKKTSTEKMMIIKDNALINASYNLEITEQRLILLAIVNARENKVCITSDTTLEIHASDYAKHFDVSLDAAYKALKEAVNNLFNRQFSFSAEYKKTGKTGVVRSRWVSRIFYVDDLAVLEVNFAPDVVPLITRLEERFTSYQLQQVSQLTSKYAMRLYELLIAWREVGKTPVFELQDFRAKVGVNNDEYKLMHQFKSRVLEPAIKQINEHTDIVATYEQQKRGRVISGLSFKFKQKEKPKKLEKKEQRDQNTIDMFCKLSDAQIVKYSVELSRFSDLSDLSTFPTYEAFAGWIANILRDPQSVREETAKRIFNALKNVGFKQHKS